MTNAPFGDNLESSIGYSLIAQTVLIKATTAIAGPICGYNIANMLGFVLSALVMLGFILAVTKNRWIALLAGYAVSFAPYYQLKIGAHFSFGFQAIFIGLIWLFYRLIKYRKKRDAVLLGLLFALAIYWDPYFPLLAAVTVVPLGFVWLVVNRRIFTTSFWRQTTYGANIKRQLKLIIIATSIVAVLVAPLVYIFSTQGAQINSDVSASRGNVLLEAQYCSTWPHEYLVPFVNNPIFKSIVGVDRYTASVNFLREHYSCGIGEDVIGLSITLLSLTLLGALAVIWERVNKRKTKLTSYLHFEPKMLIYGLVAIALSAVILSLPPMKFYNLIPTPSYELLQVTQTWRTIERIFVVVNIAFVALSAVFIAYFYGHLNLKKRRWLAAVLYVLIFGAVAIEYQTAHAPFVGNDFGTFSYSTSVPTQYTWLRDQQDIKTIAEYPLERSGGEGNSMAYYLSMQVTHKKKLFNGVISYSSQEAMKTGLKNLLDPQTVPVLKGMGVDAAIVHGVSKAELEKIPNIKILYSSLPNGFTVAGFSPLVTNDEVNIISLKDVLPRQYIVAPSSGFFRNMTYIHSAVDWQYLASTSSVLNVVSLDGGEPDAAQDVCFDIKTASPTEVDTLKPVVDGSPSPDVSIGSNYKTIKLHAKANITLNNASSHGMVLSRLGCN
jgi:membrane protease YdiL (CAAX protease family)